MIVLYIVVYVLNMLDLRLICECHLIASAFLAVNVFTVFVKVIVCCAKQYDKTKTCICCITHATRIRIRNYLCLVIKNRRYGKRIDCIIVYTVDLSLHVINDRIICVFHQDLHAFYQFSNVVQNNKLTFDINQLSLVV